MRPGFNQNSPNARRPLLSLRSSISLAVMGQLRVDYVQIAANRVDGLVFTNFRETSLRSLIDFESDRASLAEIEEFISEYNNLSNSNINEREIRITSIPVVERKLIQGNTVLRGNSIGSTLTVEIPKMPNLSKRDVQRELNAAENGSITIEELKDAYVVEKDNEDMFTISRKGESDIAHSKAASNLGITSKNFIYAGQVVGLRGF